MAELKKPTGNVIRFPAAGLHKFGFERVKKRRRSRMESHGQLNLFSPPPGQVLRLPTGIGPFEEALILDDRGDPGAEASYRCAIQEGDCPADAYCNLGIMKFKAGDRVEAFDCFTKSLEIDPRHFESHFNVGNLYFDEGDYRLSRLHYELAASIEPGFPNVHFNLGLVHALTEDYRAAATSLTRYQELAPPAEARKADDLLSSIRRTLSRSS
jgi:tetratricopeptide (TPR) repeat protein